MTYSDRERRSKTISAPHPPIHTHYLNMHIHTCSFSPPQDYWMLQYYSSAGNIVVHENDIWMYMSTHHLQSQHDQSFLGFLARSVLSKNMFNCSLQYKVHLVVLIISSQYCETWVFWLHRVRFCQTTELLQQHCILLHFILDTCTQVLFSCTFDNEDCLAYWSKVCCF